MTPEEFIKKFGVERAKQMVNADDSVHALVFATTKVSFLDLTRFVKSHEYVEIHGLQQSKEIVNNAPSDDVYYSWSLGNSGVKDKTVHIGTLRKAIADVEACQ